jgi:CheY-like chemotaxis protein
MKKIAVIEDNFDNRLILNAMIGHLYTLKEYTTGPEALASLPQATPDLILLDISLPGMDGTEVLQRLRSQPESKKIPVIALTAHAMSGDRERFLAQGFNGYLAKPILDTQPLIDLIESLLQT